MSVIINYFSENISKIAVTFFTAMTPIGELRASIPMGLGMYKLDIYSTIIFSIIGNIIPAIIIIYGLEPVSKFLMNKFKWANRFFTWLFNGTRKKYSKKFEAYSGFAPVS